MQNVWGYLIICTQKIILTKHLGIFRKGLHCKQFNLDNTSFRKHFLKKGLLLFLTVSLSGNLHMNARAHKVQKRASDPQVLKFQVIVRQPMWILGTEFSSSAGQLVLLSAESSP